ncbi:hypothetical protein KYK30_30285 [Shinella yambaruensis]|uniref:Secreted protein n=1 Tax=Shinella yambaruensis TaxID=415996 RepID=A0ABQ5ZGL1_9HYPH|nr:hypothetical protein [Shinella yambaruensis]MCJ8027118.1 hypothetical protein [Shinella yambaruensis]MCU7984009.1 hypothetical protein [Shinella yambaruensis]GLR51165.1 hypothetical protein GCM10007923_23730 [Shinella yambaruensis]
MIRAGRLALLLGMVLAGPAGAAADIVDGSYGDAEGCRYAETGGADFFFLLNKDGVTTAASYCAFKGEGNRVGGATKVAAECHEEGYEETTPYELTLTPDGGGYTVSFPDGTRWGPLMRCKT